MRRIGKWPVTFRMERWNFCPRDGQKLEADWEHCPKCGVKIAEGEAAADPSGVPSPTPQWPTIWPIWVTPGYNPYVPMYPNYPYPQQWPLITCESTTTTDADSGQYIGNYHIALGNYMRAD